MITVLFVCNSTFPERYLMKYIHLADIKVVVHVNDIPVEYIITFADFCRLKDQ